MTWETRSVSTLDGRAETWWVGRTNPHLGGFQDLVRVDSGAPLVNEMDARYIAAALNDYDPDGEMYDREHSRVPAGMS